MSATAWFVTVLVVVFAAVVLAAALCARPDRDGDR